MQWRWKPKRWWVCLILFCFVSLFGALITIAITGSYKDGTNFPRIILLGIIIFAVCDAREGLRFFPKIGWIFLVLFAHPFFMFFCCYPFLEALFAQTSLEFVLAFIGPEASTLGAVPFVIWAMRRSAYFVEPIPGTSNQKQSCLSPNRRSQKVIAKDQLKNALDKAF